MNLLNKISAFCTKRIGYPKVKLEEVFTPATAANINYITRNEIDGILASEMSTPGKQIVVYGHSGSGKTSSVRKLLRDSGYNYIRTHCESCTTFEQLILNAFDELDVFILSEKTKQVSKVFKGELELEYKKIKSAIGKEQTVEEGVSMTRLLPPQLTPQKLAQFLGVGKIVWLIEDFHKVCDTEKKRIADVIKIFVDNANDYESSKIICIGACQSAHELLQLDPNLKSRVSEVSVPLLHDEEIRSIVKNGFCLLRVDAPQSLVDKLVYYSDRLGASAHQMCMDICKGEGIMMTGWSRHKINDTAFQFAIDGFIQRSSDTLKSLYEAAVKNEIGWYILRSFSKNTMDKMSIDRISQLVNMGKQHFTNEEIVAKLDELCSPACGIIYYNTNSEKYALSSPFWHRFLRLQFSIENANKQKKKNNSKNPNLIFTNDARYQIVDESLFEFIKQLKKMRAFN